MFYLEDKQMDARVSAAITTILMDVTVIPLVLIMVIAAPTTKKNAEATPVILSPFYLTKPFFFINIICLEIMQ